MSILDAIDNLKKANEEEQKIKDMLKVMTTSGASINQLNIKEDLRVTEVKIEK